MQNVGNELRSIAITKVAQAYLCHRIGSNILDLSTNSALLDPLLMDMGLIIVTPKIFIREGARDLNVVLGGEMRVKVDHYHHTRRYGLLTAYESMLFSNKVETYLRQEVYGEISKSPRRSAAKLIESWCDRLELDPAWSEKTIRTYRNHRQSQYPVFAA